MKNTINTTPEESLAILHQISGRFLEKIAVDYGEKLEHTPSQMVELLFGKETVSLWTIEKVNQVNEYPDLATVLVKEEDSVEEKTDLVSFNIRKTITNVEELIEHVKIEKPSETPFSLVNTKAIIINFDDGSLVLERTCHWTECWMVTLLSKGEDYVFYDQWKNKAEDDNSTYSVMMEHKII